MMNTESPENHIKENLKIISKNEIDINADNLVQIMVFIANKHNIELGITLNVKGLIVSGMLVSNQTYFEGLTDEVEASNAEQVAKELFKSTFNSLANTSESSSSNGDGSQESLPLFIHLKEARMYPSQNTSPIPTAGVWWRGKISEVSSFSWGLLN